MAARNRFYQYFVEGECERKLIEELKASKDGLIIPGKVSVFNPVQEMFTDMRLRQLKRNTAAILIFDTDTGNADILKANIDYLSHHETINEVWTIPEVNNFEEEILRCTEVKTLKEVIGSKSNSDFKRDFCSAQNLLEKLSKVQFDINKLWRSTPRNAKFRDIKNYSNNIFK